MQNRFFFPQIGTAKLTATIFKCKGLQYVRENIDNYNAVISLGFWTLVMVYVVLLELKETVYRDVVELYTLKKNGHHNVHPD